MKSYTLVLDSCNADSFFPSPVAAASHLILPPPTDRRCGSFSPHDFDAQPSTSPAGSSVYVLQQRPPMGIRILKTAVLQLAEKNIAYGAVTRFKTF